MISCRAAEWDVRSHAVHAARFDTSDDTAAGWLHTAFASAPAYGRWLRMSPLSHFSAYAAANAEAGAVEVLGRGGRISRQGRAGTRSSIISCTATMVQVGGERPPLRWAARRCGASLSGGAPPPLGLPAARWLAAALVDWAAPPATSKEPVLPLGRTVPSLCCRRRSRWAVPA